MSGLLLFCIGIGFFVVFKAKNHSLNRLKKAFGTNREFILPDEKA